MPSTVREPIGPRSIDDMLLEVYGRAARTRRRRQVTAVLGAATATLLAATGLALVGGGDNEARLRVVDDGNKEKGSKVEQPAPVQTTAGGADDTGAPQSSPSSNEADPSGRRYEAALPPPADGPLPAPSVTTTTVPAPRLLGQVQDAANDAHPDEWYLDVVRGSVELDNARGVLVFTTTYRSAGAGAGSGRNEHTMTSEVQYDNALYAVTVVERDNTLSAPELDEGPCSGCVASFDPSTARLTVTVPLATFNAAVAARGSDNPPFQSSSVLDDLVVETKLGSGVTAVDADTTRDPEVQP